MDLDYQIGKELIGLSCENQMVRTAPFATKTNPNLKILIT